MLILSNPIVCINLYLNKSFNQPGEEAIIPLSLKQRNLSKANMELINQIQTSI